MVGVSEPVFKGVSLVAEQLNHFFSLGSQDSGGNWLLAKLFCLFLCDTCQPIIFNQRGIIANVQRCQIGFGLCGG